MVLSNWGKPARNALSVLTSDAVNRATTFVLYALVGRKLGTDEFGRMSLALTLFYIFQVFAAAGLKTLITREVAKDRSAAGSYLVNGSLVVLLSSTLAITVLLGFVRVMGYSQATATAVLLLGLGLLPFALAAVCEAIFQALERMQYIAYANVSVNIAKIGLAVLILSQGLGLNSLIALLLGSFAAIVLLEWWFMLRRVLRPRLELDAGFSWRMIKATSTFVGIDGVLAIGSSLSVLLLSKLAGEREVGLFNAVNQSMVPVTVVFTSLILSIFPTMCRRFDTGGGGLKPIAGQALELLLALAVPTAVGLFFLADQVLLLLYGDREFLLASGVMRIMSWNLIFAALTTVLGQVLLASLREKVTLRIVLVDALVSLGLGAILISQFGLAGAAVTAVCTRLADFLQHYLAVYKQLPGLRLERLIWKPAAASAVMAGYLMLVEHQELALVILSAGGLYAVVLGALTVLTSGGPRGFKMRYLDAWSD